MSDIYAEEIGRDIVDLFEELDPYGLRDEVLTGECIEDGRLRIAHSVARAISVYDTEPPGSDTREYIDSIVSELQDVAADEELDEAVRGTASCILDSLWSIGVMNLKEE